MITIYNSAKPNDDADKQHHHLGNITNTKVVHVGLRAGIGELL